jgi:hypothetical protein
VKKARMLLIGVTGRTLKKLRKAAKNCRKKRKLGKNEKSWAEPKNFTKICKSQ